MGIVLACAGAVSGGCLAPPSECTYEGTGRIPDGPWRIVTPPPAQVVADATAAVKAASPAALQHWQSSAEGEAVVYRNRHGKYLLGYGCSHESCGHSAFYSYSPDSGRVTHEMDTEGQE